MAPETSTKKEDTEIKEIAVSNLLLDFENPRLTSGGRKTSQLALLEELYRRYDLKDLITSLSQHGYFSEEPLIGVRRMIKGAPSSQEYLIVEGNRRLAALKLLLFKDERNKISAKNIPEVSAKIRAKLDPVPVKVYGTREEITPYLGIRHITGVKPWDSQAKANYIYKLVESGISVTKISKMVASRSDVVKRSLLTLYVLNQANKESDESWEKETAAFKFSLLYTALGYASIRKAVGLDFKIFNDPRPDPIPAGCIKELINLMMYIYGSPDSSKPAKIFESRDLKKLAAIYESSEALDALKAGASITHAFRKSAGEVNQLVDLIKEASYGLDEANGLAPHHKESEEAKRWAIRCFEASSQLKATLGI